MSRLDHDDVAMRVMPLFLSGGIATCSIVDLEVLFTTRNGTGHEAVLFERLLLTRAPLTEPASDRAMTVQGLLAEAGQHRGVPITDLLIAACAELAGLTVLHYDSDFDTIATVTGQAVEWVVPRGTVP